MKMISYSKVVKKFACFNDIIIKKAKQKYKNNS